MTRAKVASLEVPQEFAWETLIETAQTRNGGVQKALDCFYHAEEDCLVRHFDRLFGTDKFSFDIKHPQKHKEILEILNCVIMEDVDCQMDILGWVYEQHLRTGSSAARDLGQYFTDRFICEYMTELCAPGFKSVGVPESVCDPSMGTGGFLTAFVKFYNKHHADKAIDWAVQQKEIHGCDTDPKVAGVARLNLFMETGGNRSTNLLTHDSLYGDLTQTQYDVILANMPFGLKGIKHADCCERVKNLKIRGTKSEPLFLQLMMVSLALGGRCAVVVPEGMLANSSSCHNDTRKYLLDHFDLKRVIKMKGQFFMNTGIQPSILFFENTGKPTEAVEFWEVVKGDKGEISESMVVSVPRAKIDASYSFDMRRYLESDKPVANPSGFPMVKLSDISDLYSGKANRDADSGDIPFFASSGSVGKRDKHNFEGKYIITARTQSIGSVSYYDGKLWASDNTILLKVKDEAVLTSRFLYYWLMLNKSAIHNIANTGLIPLIRKSDLAEIKMPLPPLPIQDEIVATLDRIYNPGTTELADTIKMTDKAMDLVLASPGGATLEPIVEAQRLIRKSAQMVADVKTQMVAVVKASSSTSTLLSLKDICSVAFGERITQKDHKGTLYPVYGGGESNFHTDRFNREGMTCKVARFAVSEKSMVLMINQKYWLMDSGFTVSSKEKTKVVDEYLWWVLWANQARLTACSTGSCQKNISMDMFYTLEFGFPSVEVQTSVVSKIRMLQSQLTALESLQKQTEDNARFILESYLPSTPVENTITYA
jgi:restriction endonuclease S subunit